MWLLLRHSVTSFAHLPPCLLNLRWSLLFLLWGPWLFSLELEVVQQWDATMSFPVSSTHQKSSECRPSTAQATLFSLLLPASSYNRSHRKWEVSVADASLQWHRNIAQLLVWLCKCQLYFILIVKRGRKCWCATGGRGWLMNAHTVFNMHACTYLLTVL